MRYLTAEEKYKELVSLNGPINRQEIDPLIYPVILEINNLPGIVTLQSCQGHKGRYVESGHLWLWANESVMEVFYRRGFELAYMDGVENISIRFFTWNWIGGCYERGEKEIIVLEFSPMKTVFDCAHILSFLRDITSTKD